MNPIKYIKNFRDVGETINLLSGKRLLVENKLYRGGRLNSVFKHEEMLCIPTILNDIESYLKSGYVKRLKEIFSFSV